MVTKVLSFDLMESVLGSPFHSSLDQDDDQATETQKLCRALRQVIDGELTQRQQDCLRLYYFEGMKMDEVADRLGIQASTVSRHLKKAKRRIEQVLRYSFPRLG